MKKKRGGRLIIGVVLYSGQYGISFMLWVPYVAASSIQITDGFYIKWSMFRYTEAPRHFPVQLYYSTFTVADIVNAQ